jgi:hypothetical protein
LRTMHDGVVGVQPTVRPSVERAASHGDAIVRLKVVCPDGTYVTARVVDADTGEEVENVISVTWSCGVDQTATCVVYVDMTAIDAVGETRP